MAARPVIGEGLDAMVWSVLVRRANAFDPALLDLAFVFLLLGYGTKVGLAPLHAWLPDAHAELPILKGHFDRRHHLLRQALAEHHAPKAVADEWLRIDESLRTAVMKSGEAARARARQP